MKHATATPKHFICRTFKRGEKTVQQTPQNGDLLKYVLMQWIHSLYVYIYVYFNWSYSIWLLLQYLYMFNMCIFPIYSFVKSSGFVHYDIFRTKKILSAFIACNKHPSGGKLTNGLGPWGWYFLGSSTYCWWTKSCFTKDGDYTIFYRVSAPSQVVVWDFVHQQYHDFGDSGIAGL